MRTSRAAIAAATAALALSALPASNAVGTAPEPRATVDWGPCTDPQLAGKNLECGQVEAELDPARPGRGTVTLAVARLPASGAGEADGTLVVHPGGPGAVGRQMLLSLAAAAPAELSRSYDIVTYDPRGVGASTPRLECDADYWGPPWADPVPENRRAELRLLRKSTGYAADCARNADDLLRYMSTRHQAADIEALRTALGERRISFAGYGYGGHLGAAWASLYPESRDRLILDSPMRPGAGLYEHYLDQDRAMDGVMDGFFAWVARHHDVYGLGTEGAEVERVYWSLREQLAAEPAGGVAGPYELEAVFINAAWDDRFWPLMGDVLTQYGVHGNDGLVETAYDLFAREQDDNRYASFLATSCADGEWPRSWSRWHRDTEAMHAKAPFAAWNNTWNLAPCARWPGRDGQAVQIDGSAVDDALVLHATEGGGMPYEGGLAMHERLPGSRLVVAEGGVNHALSLTRGHACADDAVLDYLLKGELPADAGKGPDRVCPRMPEPQPSAPAAAGPATLADRAGAAALLTP